MNKSLSNLLLAVVAMTAVSVASAQSSGAEPTVKTIQVATVNPEQPVMSHEVASLMQTLQKAQAQHRRTGQTQDLARVDAVRRELASRGFGRATQAAPVMLAETAKPVDGDQSVHFSLAE